MPILTWPSKHHSDPQPASVITDSIIYPGGRGYPDAQPENRLIFGDNLAIMASLLPEYEGRINLIYAARQQETVMNANVVSRTIQGNAISYTNHD